MNPLPAHIRGTGYPRVVSIPSPAVASEISFQVPVDRVWRLVSGSFLLTADANAASRIPALRASRGGLIFAAGAATTATTATLAVRYGVMIGSGVIAGVATTVCGLAFNDEVILIEGDLLTTVTLAIQAGDQYSQVVIQVEEWEVR